MVLMRRVISTEPYPVCLRSEVLRDNLSKNAPVEVTGVGRFNTAPCFSTSSNNGDYDGYISKNNNDNIDTSFGCEDKNLTYSLDLTRIVYTYILVILESIVFLFIFQFLFFP